MSHAILTVRHSEGSATTTRHGGTPASTDPVTAWHVVNLHPSPVVHRRPGEPATLPPSHPADVSDLGDQSLNQIDHDDEHPDPGVTSMDVTPGGPRLEALEARWLDGAHAELHEPFLKIAILGVHFTAFRVTSSMARTMSSI